MSRYIDADRAIESLFDYCNGKKTIGQCIDDTPTEEVKPIIYYIEKLEKIKTEIKKLRYGSDTYKNAIDDVVEIIDSEITTMRKESEEEE